MRVFYLKLPNFMLKILLATRKDKKNNHMPPEDEY